MEIEILNKEGKATGKVELPEKFAQQCEGVSRHLVHEVVRAYLANQRKGTHSTLTRTEVSGGGRKPWKQKHTGRARSGSIRSPLWRGGGIIFGPKPRSYRIDLPHTKIKTALAKILVDKAQNGEVIVTDMPKLAEAKTKLIAQWLKKLSLPQNCLLVVDKKDENLALASRNLPEFQIKECQHLHPYDLLSAKKIVFTHEAVKEL